MNSTPNVSHGKANSKGKKFAGKQHLSHSQKPSKSKSKSTENVQSVGSPQVAEETTKTFQDGLKNCFLVPAAKKATPAKTVRIDESVKIRRIHSFDDEPKRSITRRLSLESKDAVFNGDEKVKRKLFSLFPQRRFSHSAIEPIRELLTSIEEQSKKEKDEIKKLNDLERKVKGQKAKGQNADFRSLSREDKLQKLQETRTEKDNEECDPDQRDWVGLRSLTGANASGWKYQDSFYGNFNQGRKPSMDTAWGRRVYDQYEIECPDSKPKNKYLNSEGDLQQGHTPRQMGLWDLIFNPEITSKLEAVQKWDPRYFSITSAM